MPGQLLDNHDWREKVDPEGMLTCTEAFADHWREAASRAADFAVPTLKPVENVVICGMGGSAIVGDLLRHYLQFESRVPIEVVRHYRLPGYVDANSLVIASSYSGNTEESLAAFAEAKRRKAQRFALSTGGKLAAKCKREGVGCFPVIPGFQPRAALAHSFVPLLVICEKWGLTQRQGPAIKEAAKVLDGCIEQYRFTRKTPRNPAKKLALKLLGKLPVIYGGQDCCQPIVMRWQAQINENAKTLAHAHVVPEMNHNEILGWDAPEQITKKSHVVVLQDAGDRKEITRRFEVMAPILKRKVDGITCAQSSGKRLLARMFSLISLGDFVSVYLALLQGHDPTPIPAINTLKQELAKSK